MVDTMEIPGPGVEALERVRSAISQVWRPPFVKKLDVVFDLKSFERTIQARIFIDEPAVLDFDFREAVHDYHRALSPALWKIDVDEPVSIVFFSLPGPMSRSEVGLPGG